MIQLQLENTSTCNAACNFCVYPEARRWGGLMSMDLYRKIIEEAAGIATITDICITGLGEPTLDPKLVERVRLARQMKPEAMIDMFSNGVYMTAVLFEALRAVGVSAIQISLNAVNEPQHRKIMELEDKFDIVCANIDYMIKYAGDVKVEVRGVVDGEQFTVEDGHTFYERWGNYRTGGHGSLIYKGNWAGDVHTERTFDPNEACGRALSQIYVTWDGKVTTCCFDPTGKQVWGDLNRQTLREVYAGEEYVNFREAHSENQAGKYEICRDCTRI